jgi:hypothetical protein
VGVGLQWLGLCGGGLTVVRFVWGWADRVTNLNVTADCLTFYTLTFHMLAR